jgi:3',5'-nucleoside bisphosphate phosphatase
MPSTREQHPPARRVQFAILDGGPGRRANRQEFSCRPRPFPHQLLAANLLATAQCERLTHIVVLWEDFRKMAGYDLHTHSSFSDGTQTPTGNVKLALERGLDGIAVTDHDTIDGIDEAVSAASGTGLEIVPGIEFSAEYDGASLHVLAYWVDLANEELRAELRRLTDTRFRRGELMVEKLQALGYDVSFERVRAIAGDDLIARPHVAQAMVEAGIVATETEAFDKFISDGGVAHVPKHALEPFDAQALVHDAGGICVLAHPGMWKGAGSVPDELIEGMAQRGMVGLEADHPDHDETQRAYYRAMADRLGLVPTGASDCHGARYGFRMGVLTTPAERYRELRRRAGLG